MTDEELTDKTHVFVGMFRPTWEKIANPRGYLSCTCGMILQNSHQLRKHWQLGHFDYPVYKKIEKQ